MKHLSLAVTAAAAVAMLGLPPAQAMAQAPASPAGSCAAITGAAGSHYHAAVALSRAAAAERAARDGVLAAHDDRASQRHMSRFYAAVGRGLARNCYL